MVSVICLIRGGTPTRWNDARHRTARSTHSSGRSRQTARGSVSLELGREQNRKSEREKPMCCSMWLNRGTAVGLLLGLVLGAGGAVAWFTLRESPTAKVITEPPEPQPVTLAVPQPV